MNAGSKPPSGKPRGSAPASKNPPNPHLVLLAALVLPGSGQVLNGNPMRGLTMLFFMISLGWVTYHMTTPQHSFIGRHAGGIFVYAMSLLDAYKWARHRYEFFRMHGVLPGGSPRR